MGQHGMAAPNPRPGIGPGSQSIFGSPAAVATGLHQQSVRLRGMSQHAMSSLMDRVGGMVPSRLLHNFGMLVPDDDAGTKLSEAIMGYVDLRVSRDDLIQYYCSLMKSCLLTKSIWDVQSAGYSAEKAGMPLRHLLYLVQPPRATERRGKPSWMNVEVIHAPRHRARQQCDLHVPLWKSRAPKGLVKWRVPTDVQNPQPLNP